MSEFQGLHNPDGHEASKRSEGWAWCTWCDTKCVRGGHICHCCLAAEVERLTGEHSEAVALGLHNPDWHSPTSIRLTAVVQDLWRAEAQESAENDNHQHEFVARWVCECGVQDDPVYASAAEHALQAEVKRLTVANKVLQYGLRQSCADSLEHRRRIEKALTLLYHPTEVNGCTCLAHQIAAVLRGES